MKQFTDFDEWIQNGIGENCSISYSNSLNNSSIVRQDNGVRERVRRRYNCHRSGKYEPKGTAKKTMTSYKIGGMCPSQVVSQF